ncbi:MFS transporter [Aliiglaciecola sp. LCG003]|uniref:MFS transporter n=1 Tax=Aliiglaciecola sp. LCG003 TaxID=3053655 RepID=UPI0025739DA4|nr:MFS transporter [Aliiglaciecola sp. LCG003]WJG09566.1 MFS transporter [Aliiglaciecola sp. LCG003]
MINDPRPMIEQSPMHRFQIFAVVMCILLNALDGFDVLAISFASPGIASEWNIDRAALGIVLAMELIGMAIGSITLGNLADRFGRRPTILGCLTVMTIGMTASAFADSLDHLLIFRFLTGLGVGGMLASTNALVAEYANAKYRNLAVILMAAGYPIGAILGGSVATVLLDYYSWHAIFVFGGIVTGLFLIVSFFYLPESINFLVTKQPQNALSKINHYLQKMAHTPIAQLPEKSVSHNASSFKLLISGQYRSITILLVAAYFTHIMTFYYILKWIPKIVVDIGFEPSSAGSVLVWANVGGAIGAILLGLFASRFQLRPLLIGILVLSFCMVVIFGLGPQSLFNLSLISAATGFFTNAGVVGLYALMAEAFPAEVRGSGTGLVIGIGRGGAALGPVIAGYLFVSGFDLMDVSIAMGLGALFSAAALFYLGRVMQARLSNSPA